MFVFLILSFILLFLSSSAFILITSVCLFFLAFSFFSFLLSLGFGDGSARSFHSSSLSFFDLSFFFLRGCIGAILSNCSGGGGISCVVQDSDVFDKGGCNVSVVHGVCVCESLYVD